MTDVHIRVDPKFKKVLDEIKKDFAKKGIRLSDKEVSLMLTELFFKTIKKKKTKKRRESFSLFDDDDIFHL